MASFSSLYDILKIPGTASQEEIKSAFRKLAKIYHPDKNRDSPKSAVLFITIHNAYTILSDPAKRQEYDYFLKTSNFSKKSSPSSRPEDTQLETSVQFTFSPEGVLSHLNHVIWDIEIFLNNEYKKYFNRKFSGTTVQQYLLTILTFIDQWVLFPAGYHDYFMRARRRRDIKISDYIGMIDSENTAQGHKPFYSLMNYFYDIRKRLDKFLNKATIEDLYSEIPDCGIRLIDAIMEAQNYTIHYLIALHLALAGKNEVIQAFKHSRACFRSI